MLMLPSNFGVLRHLQINVEGCLNLTVLLVRSFVAFDAWWEAGGKPRLLPFRLLEVQPDDDLEILRASLWRQQHIVWQVLDRSRVGIPNSLLPIEGVWGRC